MWGPVRRIGSLYGVMMGAWFVGVAKRYDPGVIYEYPNVKKKE